MAEPYGGALRGWNYFGYFGTYRLTRRDVVYREALYAVRLVLA